MNSKNKRKTIVTRNPEKNKTKTTDKKQTNERKTIIPRNQKNQRKTNTPKKRNNYKITKKHQELGN